MFDIPHTFEFKDTGERPGFIVEDAAVGVDWDKADIIAAGSGTVVDDDTGDVVPSPALLDAVDDDCDFFDSGIHVTATERYIADMFHTAMTGGDFVSGDKVEAAKFSELLATAPRGGGEHGSYDWAALALSYNESVKAEWREARAEKRPPRLFLKNERDLERFYHKQQKHALAADVKSTHRHSLAELANMLRLGAVPNVQTGRVEAALPGIPKQSHGAGDFATMAAAAPLHLLGAHLHQRPQVAVPTEASMELTLAGANADPTSAQARRVQRRGRKPTAAPAGTSPMASAVEAQPKAKSRSKTSVTHADGPILYPGMVPPKHLSAHRDIREVQQEMLRSGYNRKCCGTCGHFLSIGHFGSFSYHANKDAGVCNVDLANRVPLGERFRGWCECNECSKYATPALKKLIEIEGQRIRRLAGAPAAGAAVAHAPASGAALADDEQVVLLATAAAAVGARAHAAERAPPRRRGAGKT